LYVIHMTDMARSRIGIQWPQGGPGVITFHWTSGIPAGPIDESVISEFHDELDGMITGFKGVMPTDVSMIVERDVYVLTPETGAVTAILTDPTVRTGQSGTASNASTSRATQVCYNLQTDNYTAGKRLRGRQFWGPLGPNAIVAGGVLTSSLTGDPFDFYAAICTGVGPRLAVWHRPSNSSAGDGYYGDVVNVTVSSIPATLRSRKR
jgi:hypothetical protein